MAIAKAPLMLATKPSMNWNPFKSQSGLPKPPRPPRPKPQPPPRSKMQPQPQHRQQPLLLRLNNTVKEQTSKAKAGHGTDLAFFSKDESAALKSEWAEACTNLSRIAARCWSKIFNCLMVSFLTDWDVE